VTPGRDRRHRGRPDLAGLPARPGVRAALVRFCLRRPVGYQLEWLIEPDPGRIAAVLDGYTRWRPVIDAEREALADGIRFGAACAGAIHFERALIDGVHGPTMDARPGCLRNRIAVSQDIADLAARHLGAR
jgi:hypothetical protein